MKKSSFILLLAVYAAFFALGMPDGAFGVAWPDMRGELSLPLEMAASLVVVHSIFYSVTAGMEGRLAAKFGLDKLCGAGLVFLLAGILGFSFSPNLWGLMASTGIMGIGMGMLDSAANAFAAKHFSARHMSWLHCFWGLGGAVSPLIMTQMIVFFSWRAGYHAVFAVQAAATVFVLITIAKGLWAVSVSKKDDERRNSVHLGGDSGHRFLQARRYQVMQWIIFLLYVAVEYSVTFWTVSVLIESRGMNIDIAGIFPAVYLGFMVAGRFVSGYFAGKFSGTVMIRTGFLVSIVGLAILVFTDNIVGIVGIALVGAGFAPVFPCLMHETSRRFDPALLPKLVGLQVAAAGAGAASSTLLMGQVLAHISLEALFPMIILLVVVTFLLNEIIELAMRRK